MALNPRSETRRGSRKASLGLHPMAVAAALALAPALAAAQSPNSQTVTVTGGRSSANAAGVAGFGDVPLYQSPFSAAVITTSQLSDAGITGLGDLTRLDAGTTDAYNAPGYWGMLAVRGFTLDPQFNYRRDGLPVNAETMLPLANKQALELLKGTSGLQAGTSAPGGLVNLVVKRPAGPVHNVAIGWSDQNTRSIAVDVGNGSASFGWRVNAEYADLQPPTFASRGHRNLLAVAVDAQLTKGLLLEAEFEHSLQQQPSTPGISLLGPRLPSAGAIDPRTNLNNQPWRLPVVMQGDTGSVRLTQTLDTDLQFVAHAMRQRLGTDDRIAFPFGCSAENDYTRYCSDGSFDLYDFRSEGERRTTDALDLSIAGKASVAGMVHRYSAGVLSSRFTARFNQQAYNWVGTATIDGQTITPPDPSLTDENTNRDERSTEWRLQDSVSLADKTSAWIGLRHTSLDRRSVRTDGSRGTAYVQTFTTPWLALSHKLSGTDWAYASWGQGTESNVAPGRSRYTNAGQALSALKSRQIEAGYKHHGVNLDWNVAAFDIRRPEWIDVGSCDEAGTCTRTIDGWSRHRGIEAEAEWRTGPWSLRGSAMLLKARREGATDPAANGLRPTNVPATSLKAQVAYNVSALPGLALMGFVTHEGDRMVLPDNSIQTPGWTRIDFDARYTQRTSLGTVIWRAGIDNLANARAWKEAPFQYGHAYLYPLAPRGLHLSVQTTL